jgi:hypothetical protein
MWMVLQLLGVLSMRFIVMVHCNEHDEPSLLGNPNSSKFF